MACNHTFDGYTEAAGDGLRSERDGDGDGVGILHYAATAEVIQFAEVTRRLREDMYVDDARVSRFAVRGRGCHLEAVDSVLRLVGGCSLYVALPHPRQLLHSVHEDGTQGGGRELEAAVVLCLGGEHGVECAVVACHVVDVLVVFMVKELEDAGGIVHRLVFQRRERV